MKGRIRRLDKEEEEETTPRGFTSIHNGTPLARAQEWGKLKGSLEAGRVEFGVKEVHDDRWT